MKRIRIGKDISMRWEITTDSAAIPLEGRDLTVEIKSPIGIVSNIPYRVDGNSLIMTYYGAEQKRVGEYSITLWENKGKTGQNVVDAIKAFELVRTSQEEDDFVGGDLQIESVDLGTENFDILTEGGYRAINIDTLQAEALEDSVNIKGKTYSNESFTITLPKANLDTAGVMSADDKQTLQEHGNRIAQIKTSCEENAADIERVSNVVDTHESRLGGIDAEISSLNTEVSALQSKVDENTTSISQINTELNNKNDEIAQINNKLAEHTESINAKITTERIENGAVTTEKIATSAFDSTLSVSGKIAPADVVGEKLTELKGKTSEISSTTTQDNDDEITITDNDGNVVATINKEGCDFKNMKNNGNRVEAIPEILHDEAIGGDSEQTWESNDGTEVYAKINEHGLSAKVFLDVPEFAIPPVVEPDDSIVDSGYSSPIGRSNVKRADWSATDKYLYYDFLAHYYDGYINETSSYKVTRRSLGSDSSNMGYELFEYDFRPAKYSKVVMLSAGMNTCETGGIWGLATFIKAMMTSNDAGFKFLRENVRFKVLPVICPASFDQATLKYENYNGVAINRNFDYKRSFYDVVWATKGDYPDSEIESRILKQWMNDNAWRADLYIDCHQDPDAGEDKGDVLSYVICSDNDTKSRIKGCMTALVNYYKDKGTIPESVTPKIAAWTEKGNVYPKTKYCKDICGIRALMIEQYCASTMYGSDGTTINDTFQIKQYVAILRLYIFAALAGNKAVKTLGELGNFIK